MQSQMSLKKFARKQRREARKKKDNPSLLDLHNDQLAAELKDDSTHMKVLHPTKGYRNVSVKKLIAAEGLPGMIRVFVDTIQQAQAWKRKLDQKEAAHGN